MRSPARALVIGVLWLIGGHVVCAAEPRTNVPVEQEPGRETPQFAVEQPRDDAAQDDADRRNAALPVYTPPRRGAPKTRVGGGTRQVANDDVVVMVLSPPHTGLTQQAQPTLYWFLSGEHIGPFEFVITTPDAASPLWRMRINEPFEAGIHALSLREHNVELAEGIEYQWSVAIVRDPDRRSRDLVTIGTLQRVEDVAPPPQAEGAGEAKGAGQAEVAGQAEGADAVRTLAQDGFWYDALQRLGELGGGADDHTKVQAFCAALLDQADLPQIADYVRSDDSRAPRASC